MRGFCDHNISRLQDPRLLLLDLGCTLIGLTFRQVSYSALHCDVCLISQASIGSRKEEEKSRLKGPRPEVVVIDD